MDKKPRITIYLTTPDYLIEIVGLTGIAGLFIFPVFFFNDLPNQIPKHFNALGQVDSYGNRGIIWLLPAIGLVLYVGLTILNKFPYAFNYPSKVTNENAEKLYTLATRIIRLLKVIVILSFAILNFNNIEITLNRAHEIEKSFLPIFITVLIVLIGSIIYYMLKKRIGSLHPRGKVVYFI